MCSGGTSKEESFTITRLVNRFFYKCWRASCGFKGFLGFDKATQYVGKGDTPKQPLKAHKVYTGDISDLPAGVEEWLVAKYGIPAETLFEYKVGWSYDKDRLVVPIMGPGSSSYGVSLRDLSGTKQPKTLSYRFQLLDDRIPLMSWYVPHWSDANHVFVVEDQFSAMKIASLGFNAVALIGCDVSLVKAMAISKVFKKASIFLDFDALEKAKQDMKKVGWLFEYTSILFDAAKRDPKDIPREELRTKLREERDRIKDFSGLSTG